MKKKIPALLLALSLLLTIPAQAVLEAGFSRQRSYAGEFSDLKADSPFYDNVIALYEYGLANGKANGTFGLQDPLTVGQVVIFAGRIRGSYRTGNPEEAAAYRQEGAPEAQAYLRYLQVEGVLGAELDGILSQAASRAQVAHVLARVLPEEALPSVHSELVDAAYATGRYIADVTGDTPYAQDILDLYRKGVCVGSDAAGTFLPGEPITRGAAAAMITRRPRAAPPAPVGCHQALQRRRRHAGEPGGARDLRRLSLHGEGAGGVHPLHAVPGGESAGVLLPQRLRRRGPAADESGAVHREGLLRAEL